MRTADGIGTRAWSPFPEPYAIRRREALYRWFASLCVQRGVERVLDAGCGDGFGAAILAGAGLDVVAVDTDIASLALASRAHRFGKLQFRRADARRVAEADGAFDAVLSPSLIEHLPDPLSALLEARRLLRAGGIAAIATPNRLTASPGRTVPIAAEHAWEFTPAELAALAGGEFRAVTMCGLFHAARLRLLDRLTGQSTARTVARIAPADRSWWMRSALDGVSASDFRVSTGELRRAIDLVAVVTA